MSYDEISIAHIDGLCSALRERMKFSVRKARTFVKKRKTIKELLEIYQTYHNLIDVRHGETPCIKERITNHVWRWGELFNKKVPVEI
jgi:hypothetical protein